MKNLTRRRLIQSASALTTMLALPNNLFAKRAKKSKGLDHFIFINLIGAPSQFETFDPKPGTSNGGPTKAIKTKTKGLIFAENLAGLAEHTDSMAVLRMTSKFANHQLAQYYLQSGGYLPVGALKHPSLCSLVGWGKENTQSQIPSTIAIGKSIRSSGYLGMKYDPFVIEKATNSTNNITVPKNFRTLVSNADKIRNEYNAISPLSHTDEVKEELALQSRASTLSLGTESTAFDLNNESPKTKQLYGTHEFGSSCLLARRILQAGVPAVQLSLGGWDTHQDNFERTNKLTQILNQSVTQLIKELKSLDLYDKTLILIAGEFGRKPTINANDGRDHYSKSWGAILAGGIKGHQIIGETTSNGDGHNGKAVTPKELSYSILELMGMKPNKWINTSIGRPIKISPGKNNIPGFLF